MQTAYHPLLFLFVDGIGLAPASNNNPFSTVPTPAIEALLGSSLTSDALQRSEGLVLGALDATLGLPGLPQSATGQASLLTGHNGAELMERHQTGFPGPRLRALVEAHGLLERAVAMGRRVTFANPYTRRYLAALETGKRRASVTTCAVLAAGLELRFLKDLHQGRAVSWDYCRDQFAADVGEDLQPIEASQAGRDLVSIAADHDLTLHETFLTDLAGHLKRGIAPEEAVGRLDAVVGGLQAARPPELTWILTSDHGNLENVDNGSHTTNPVPLLAVGPAAHLFADIGSILGVTPAILELLRRPK
jgi:2,3-bisphosphoglycerate-independent phosphoglycerate mutase